MGGRTLRVEPVPALDRLPRYSVGRPPFETDLNLDFNESLVSLPVTGAAVDLPSAHLYPWTEKLEAQLARRLGVEPDRVIVTCGADDALERAVRSVCCPDRRAVMVKPTYGMPWRYAITSGAEIVTVAWWRGSFPVDEVCDACGDDAALLVLVSPNNPTGAVITRDEFTEVATRLPKTLIVHDQAYLEFSDPEFDLTKTALTIPNVVLVRTFSKAWGGAGLRAGYAVGDPRVIDWMRRIGQPFPVSRPTLDILEKMVTPDAEPSRDRVDRIRAQRTRLTEVLAELGAEPLPSQGSFVAARFADAAWVRNAMASLGIAIRGFPGRSELNDWLRTTMPGDEEAFERLETTFRTVLRPEALIVDLGGEPPRVARLPAQGDRIREFAALSAANREERGSPITASLQTTLERLDERHAWLVGSTPDAIRTARAARVLPIGLVTPGDGSDSARTALSKAGAARVLDSIEELLDLLP